MWKPLIKYHPCIVCALVTSNHHWQTRGLSPSACWAWLSYILMVTWRQLMLISSAPARRPSRVWIRECFIILFDLNGPAKRRYTVDALIFSVDVKFLETYQQIYIYLILILGNLGFINMICYIDQASFLIWQRDSFCFRLFVLVDSKGLFNSDCFRLLYIKDLALGFSSTPHLWWICSAVGKPH